MKNKGKLIVLEGVDGSGKSTQFKRLCENLASNGVEFQRLVFPRYDNESSALIRMYLNGSFGDNPDCVNAYAASLFFAIDRYASYISDWKDYYLSGGLLLADRYTSSNAVHQGAKLCGDERREFFDWLYELEYDKLCLPEPDLVIYLDVDAEISKRRIERREINKGIKADIHERDLGFIQKGIESGRMAAEHYSWKLIEYSKNGEEREIEEKQREILGIVESYLAK